jgi:hypothetical protein
VRESIYTLLLGILFGFIFILVLVPATEQHASEQFLIHCTIQTSKDTYREEYHVVEEYWTADDGCMEAKYHGEVLTDLCEACHVESKKKFDEYMNKQFRDLGK